MSEGFKKQLDKFCRISAAFFAVGILLITLIYLLPKRDYQFSRDNVNYIESFTDIDGNKVNIWDFNAPQEGMDIYCTISDLPKASVIMLMSENTFLDISINGIDIISDDRQTNPVGLKSNGSCWKKIGIATFSMPINIKIRCYPCYTDNKCRITHMYIGNSGSCVFNILMEHLPATVISVFFSLFAIILICYFIYYYFRYRTGRDFLFVGIALFTTSVWSTLDTAMFSFTWGNSSHFLFLSDIFFLMIPLSFGLICSYRSSGKYKVSLNLFTLVCEINMILSFIFFFFFDVDFYYTKWSTIALVILSIPLLCRLVFTYQDENKIIRNNVVVLTFLIILFGCILMWLIRIKAGFTHDRSFLIRTSIVCFNFCIVVYHAKMTMINYKQKYKQHIVHEFQIKDRVTGFYNRTALTENASKYSTALKKSTVGIAYFKLRHVKQVNETYGYENGTSLIQEFTSVIKTAFPEGCDCYRIGTNKFYIMVPGSSASEIYSDAIATVERNVKEINDFRAHPYQMIYNTSFVYDSNISIFDLLDMAADRA